MFIRHLGLPAAGQRFLPLALDHGAQLVVLVLALLRAALQARARSRVRSEVRGEVRGRSEGWSTTERGQGRDKSSLRLASFESQLVPTEKW